MPVLISRVNRVRRKEPETVDTRTNTVVDTRDVYSVVTHVITGERRTARWCSAGASGRSTSTSEASPSSARVSFSLTLSAG